MSRTVTERSTARRALLVLTACALAVTSTGILAHPVPVEPIVHMFVQPQGQELHVLLRVPTSVLADANLPTREGGLLDASALDQPLRLVAAEVAGNLEIRQDGRSLPQPTATVVVSSAGDGSFDAFSTALAHMRPHGELLVEPLDIQKTVVDIDLRYQIEARGTVSARLNGLRVQGLIVRTIADYVLPSGQTRRFDIAGPPERVTFEPDTTDVMRQFARRGLQELLAPGDHLLLLFCLAIPFRRARNGARLFAAVIAGQCLAIAASAISPTLPAPWLLMFAMVGASVVVIAALQNLVAARPRWTEPLAFGFGVLSGVALGSSLQLARPFAGVHFAVAFMVFVVAIGIGQAWIGTLLWSARAWLHERGLPERATVIGLSVLAAHAAMHRVTERAEALAQTDSFVFAHALLLLTFAWACVMLGVTLFEIVASRSSATRDSSLASTMGTR